jgi:hypothetical protein
MLGLSACARSGAEAATTSPDPQTTVSEGTGSRAGGISAGGTAPQVRPRQGGRHTTFVLGLTSRTQLGVRGVLATEYLARVTGPSGQGCVTVAARTIDHGSVGERVTVAFAPGRMAWCAGDYRGVIYLARGPHCTRGPGGPHSQVCPEFASQLAQVGRFSWRVR